MLEAERTPPRVRIGFSAPAAGSACLASAMAPRGCISIAWRPRWAGGRAPTPVRQGLRIRLRLLCRKLVHAESGIVKACSGKYDFLFFGNSYGILSENLRLKFSLTASAPHPKRSESLGNAMCAFICVRVFSCAWLCFYVHHRAFICKCVIL